MAHPIAGRLGFATVVVLSAALLNCARMSESATDEAAGR